MWIFILHKEVLAWDKETISEKVDKLYDSIGMIMSFLAINFTSAAMELVSLGAFIVPLTIFPVLIFVILKFFREMRVMQGAWDGAWRCLKPIKLSKERLQRRLNYLTKRFDDHAPYWQFVIWGRQIPLLVLLYYVKNIWVVSIFTAMVCVISLVLHIRVKPFKHDFQNLMDTCLMVTNIVLIVAAVLYSEVLRPQITHESASTAPEVILTVVILVTMFGSLITFIYLRLWIVFWNALQKDVEK